MKEAEIGDRAPQGLRTSLITHSASSGGRGNIQQRTDDGHLKM